MSFGPEQLEILRRRAEEDFKHDMADIERLQRRLFARSVAASQISAPVKLETVPDSVVSAAGEFEAMLAPSMPEDLGNSLRAMLSSAS
jgi:hypothetical protein